MDVRGLVGTTLVLAAAAAGVSGCTGDDSRVEIHIDGGNTHAHIVANQGPKTPTGPLTVTERKKLLAATRKDPERIRTLTNRERAFLAGAALD